MLTIQHAAMAISVLVLVANFWVSHRRNIRAGNDPWEGYSLEWATTSPPPEHNFTELPLIRSERPVFDRRHAGRS